MGMWKSAVKTRAVIYQPYRKARAITRVMTTKEQLAVSRFVLRPKCFSMKKTGMLASKFTIMITKLPYFFEMPTFSKILEE